MLPMRQIQMMPRRFDVPWRKPDPTCVLNLSMQDQPISSPLKDRSGNGNDGVITGATWVKLPVGLWALSFDGSDDIVTVADSPSIRDIFSTGGTAEAWIKANSDGQSDFGRIFDKVGELTGFGDSGWCFYVGGEVAGYMKLFFMQYRVFGTGSWQATNRVVPVSVPTHVIITYNDSNFTNDPVIYINGQAVAITETATPITAVTSDVGKNLCIGNALFYENRTFDGIIALPRLTRRIVDAAEAANSFAQKRHLFGV